MTALGVLAAIALIFAAGFGLTLTLWRGTQPILVSELFGLSWFLGAGVVSALLAIGGILINGGPLIAFVTFVCLACVLQGRNRLRNGTVVYTGLRTAAPWERWTCLLLLLPVVCFAFENARVAIAWDGLYIWEFKARSAFLAGGSLPAEFFSDPARLRFHPSYPLYLPFTELWAYLWIGDCNQTAVKTLFPVFYASGIALLWSGVFRLSGKAWGASLTALLPLVIPTMFNRGYGLAQGYCDFLVASVYFAGVAALLTWRLNGIRGAWFVAAACGALLPWMKQEGVILLASLIAQAAIAHGWRGWKTTIAFAAPGVAVIAAWKVSLWTVAAASQNVYQALTPENLIENIPRLPLIMFAVSAEFSELSRWSLLWFLMPVALGTLALQRRREVLYLTLALLIPMAGYVIPYMLTRLDLAYHIGTSLDRLILQLSMISLLGLGLALGSGANSQFAPCRKPEPTQD